MEYESPHEERLRHDREIAEENKKRQIRLGHIERPEAVEETASAKETASTEETEEKTTAKSTSKKSSAKK